MKDDPIGIIGSLITEDPDMPVDDDDVFAGDVDDDSADIDEIRMYIQNEINDSKLRPDYNPDNNAVFIHVDNFGDEENLHYVLADLSDEFEIEEEGDGFYVSEYSSNSPMDDWLSRRRQELIDRGS